MDSRRGVLFGTHVLVIEDDRDGREILEFVLRYFGAEVTAVTGAEEALALFAHIEPDVVIADMMLGSGDDGLRLLKDARRRKTRAPFIAISAQDFDADQMEGAGFAAYLRKPLDHVTLVDTVLSVIDRRRG
jgi:CheY-like chemotaxis protein